MCILEQGSGLNAAPTERQKKRKEKRLVGSSSLRLKDRMLSLFRPMFTLYAIALSHQIGLLSTHKNCYFSAISVHKRSNSTPRRTRK